MKIHNGSPGSALRTYAAIALLAITALLLFSGQSSFQLLVIPLGVCIVAIGVWDISVAYRKSVPLARLQDPHLTVYTPPQEKPRDPRKTATIGQRERDIWALLKKLNMRRQTFDALVSCKSPFWIDVFISEAMKAPTGTPMEQIGELANKAEAALPQEPREPYRPTGKTTAIRWTSWAN